MEGDVRYRSSGQVMEPTSTLLDLLCSTSSNRFRWIPGSMVRNALPIMVDAVDALMGAMMGAVAARFVDHELLIVQYTRC